MKLYGGWVYLQHRFASKGQTRLVVRAKSMVAVQRALENLGIKTSINFLRNYWSTSGNAFELTLTEGTSNKVFAVKQYGDEGELLG